MSVLFCCSAQVTEIVPITEDFTDHLEDGVYFKDVENSYNLFEGTYFAQNGSTTFTLIIKKFSQVMFGSGSTDYNYEDELRAKLFVSDPTNALIFYNSPPGLNYDSYEIGNISNVRDNAIRMYFDGIGLECNFEFQFKLTRDPNNQNQLTYSFIKSEGYSPLVFSDIVCPDLPPPAYVPLMDLVFIKQ